MWQRFSILFYDDLKEEMLSAHSQAEGEHEMSRRPSLLEVLYVWRNRDVVFQTVQVRATEYLMPNDR